MLTSLLERRVIAERHGTLPPTVVALHGWGRSRHDWNRALEGLDALALDLPGFGASSPPEEPWSVVQYANFLRPLLNKEAPIVLVGHSFGGRIACQMAADNPQAVRGLVLSGVPLLRGTLPKPRSPLRYRALRALSRAGVVSELTLERARQKYGSTDYKNASGVMRGVLVKAVNEDYLECLEAIRNDKIPVALVWGEDDTTVPTSVAASAKQTLGSIATLELVAGSGHLLDAPLSLQLRTAIRDMTLRDARARATPPNNTSIGDEK